MDTTEIVVAAFAVLIGGLLLPLSHGWRWTLILALAALSIMTLLGGGAQYVATLFQ
jgi:hypothetical protein